LVFVSLWRAEIARGAMSEGKPRHILHVFPTFAIGGSQSRFVQLARLHGNRYRHSVIALDGVQTMGAQLPDGIAITPIFGAFKTGSHLQGVATARAALKRIAPDLLVSYNWGSMDWCVARQLQTSLKHVHIEDGFGPEEVDRQLARRILLRRLVLSDNNTTTVIPSRKLESIALTAWKLSPRRVHYIPNGIDLARFSRGDENRGPGRPLIIGTVATLRREKNLVRLIKLFAQAMERRPASNMQLMIVGDGPERDALETAATQSAGRNHIRFEGATSEPEKYLVQMDVFALTSDTEQMPLSVLEAMATELPIVSFDVGDLSNMVSTENAPMVSIRSSDETAFVRTLLNFIDDGELRRRIGASNRAKAVSRFDERSMAADYAEIFG
jgi:glycosyltransferase involved in cell wall biosynthesis